MHWAAVERKEGVEEEGARDKRAQYLKEIEILETALDFYKDRIAGFNEEELDEERDEFFAKIATALQNGDVLEAGMPRLMPPRKRKLSDEGEARSLNKVDRIMILREELAASLMRLNMHGQPMPHWLPHIAAANAAMAGGGVGPLIAGKPRTVATDLLGAVAGVTTPKYRYKALSEIIFVTELQTTGEMKKQTDLTIQMMTAVTELSFLNQFGDKNGLIQWSSFTKSVADALGQPVAAPPAADM